MTSSFGSKSPRCMFHRRHDCSYQSTSRDRAGGRDMKTHSFREDDGSSPIEASLMRLFPAEQNVYSIFGCHGDSALSLSFDILTIPDQYWTRHFEQLGYYCKNSVLSRFFNVSSTGASTSMPVSIWSYLQKLQGILLRLDMVYLLDAEDKSRCSTGRCQLHGIFT